MKYYIDKNKVIYAYEEDGTQDKFIGDKTQITLDEVEKILNPPPTLEEIIAAANAVKQRLTDEANTYMNSKQWPGKAAIGRLKGDDLLQYNVWLDYLDALDAIDTTNAPEIEWPTPPVV